MTGRFLTDMDFKHELKRISFEFVIRFSELFLVGLALSLLLQLLVYMNVFEHKYFVIAQFVAFAAFQGYNIRACLMSEKRIHNNYFRYYFANIAAYLAYILISYTIYYTLGISYFSYMFGICLTLTTQRFMTYSYLFTWLLIFHVITLAIIIFSVIIKNLFNFKKKQ